MSGENDFRPSSWSVDTLKEFMNQRFADQDKAVQAALLAAKEAVLKAEVASEKRFESVNEFRAQLADQTNTLMPRAEVNTRFDSLSEKISDLTSRITRTEASTTGSQLTVGRVIAIVGVFVAFLGIILSLVVLIANGKI
jgi:hypothetical protein